MQRSLFAAGLGLVAGCGWTAGASTTAWVSHRGKVRYEVEAPVGLDTRFGRVNTEDKAGSFALLMRPSLSYIPETDSFAPSFGPSFGGNYFDGRYGVGGFLMVGGRFDTDPATSARPGRVFVRLQARIERETNNGDWRIDPVEDQRIPYRRRTHAHSLVGFNFGIEFVAGVNDLKPALSIGAGLSYRGLWEQD